MRELRADCVTCRQIEMSGGRNPELGLETSDHSWVPASMGQTVRKTATSSALSRARRRRYPFTFVAEAIRDASSGCRPQQTVSVYATDTSLDLCDLRRVAVSLRKNNGTDLSRDDVFASNRRVDVVNFATARTCSRRVMPRDPGMVCSSRRLAGRRGGRRTAGMALRELRVPSSVV